MPAPHACPAATLYKPDGTSLASDSCVSSTGDEIDAQLPVVGTYAIVIDHNTAGTGSLTLTLSQDLTSSITIDGPAVTVSLSRAGQNVRVAFDGTAGQQVGLGITSITFPTCPAAVIYKPDGTTLASDTCMNIGGDEIDTQLPVTGIYTILVDSRASTTGSLALTLSQDLTSTIAIDGPSVQVTINRAGQNVRATFDGTAGQQVGLGVTGITFPTCPAAVIYKPDGTSLVSNSCIATGGGDLDAQLPLTGTYTILVDSGDSKTGSLALTLSQDQPDSIDIDGTSVTTSISRAGQNLRVAFAGSAGQFVGLGMTAGTFPSCPYVTLYKPDASVLALDSCVSSGGEDIDVQLPATGTYTIFIDQNNGQTGSLTLTLSQDQAGSITIDGSSVTVSISRAGQNARVAFEGVAGQRVGLGLTGLTITGSCASAATVYRPEGTSLASDGCLTTSGDDIDAQLPVNGTYTIFIDHASAKTASITLTLSQEQVDSVVIDGAAATVTVSRPGQNARVTFSGSAGQYIGLGLTGLTFSGTCSARADLYKPDGTSLASDSCLSSTGDDIDRQLTTSGTYSIVIDSDQAKMGSVTLTLSQDLTGTIAVGGPPVTATISRAGQNVRITFDGSAGQQVSLAISNVTFSGCNGRVSILRPDGTTLASDSCALSGDRLNAQLPVTGTYTIFVDSDVAQTGSMTLTLT